MSVPLPNWPGPVSVVPSPMRAGNDLMPPLGGPVQRIERLGNRFRFAVTMPPMSRADTEVWASALLDGYGATVTLEWPQPPEGVGAPGAPVVDGAGQAGRLLNLRGFTPGYVIRRGQLVTLLVAGTHYALMPSAQVAADQTGRMSLPFWPMLRVSPPNGATLEVAQPIIEGRLSGDDGSWTVDVAEETGLTFTISEN